MRLSALGECASNINFKSAQSALEKGCASLPQTIIPPKYNMPQNFWRIPWDIRENMRIKYIDQLYQTFFDGKGNVNPDIAKFLDDTKFEITFKSPRGGYESACTTIKDFINSSIKQDRGKISEYLFHGTYSPRAMESIPKEGFNTRFICNTNLGPGFYFTPSEGEAREYGNVIRAMVSGTIARANDRFYENVTGYGVNSQVLKYLGLNTEVCSDIDIQHSFGRKVINEYSRKFITEDLGVDILCGFGGNSIRDYCFCVLNPDSISKVTKY